MADYILEIEGIHNENELGHITDEHDQIIIDPKTRQLSLSSEFNSTIAYAGDINSQIIRFVCPETYDGHSLKDCSNHEIRWYNIGSGVGDTSKLEVGDSVEGGFILSWLVPPEAVTKSGQLQIVISIYDKAIEDEKEIVKYQWNTASFNGLTVGTTLENVDVTKPSKDKILILNINTRKITLPNGYNTTIATQGDVGITEVYIETSRYIGGMDLLDEQVNTVVQWRDSQGIVHSEEDCTVSKMYSIVEEDDLVLITWHPSPALINHHTGTFSFYVLINKFAANTKIERQWYSLANEQLQIAAIETLEQDDDAEDVTQYGIKVYFPLDEEEFNNVLNEQFGYPMTN